MACSKKVVKEYDTKELLQSKNEIEKWPAEHHCGGGIIAIMARWW
jgi:hypothetical protein